jgi:hypothetical protein
MPPDGDTQRGCTKFFPSEMKGVQLDVGRVDMTLCKNASNRDMHVCFSRSAIVAGTESASHGLRSSLGSEKAVDFSKRTLPPRFKNKTRKEVSSELKSQRLSHSEERQEAVIKQALALATRKRGHAYSNAPERPLTWRAFLPFRFSGQIAGGMCRNGQKCPKLRAGPHATTKECTNMDVLGRFRVPSRPTARRSGSALASQEDEAEGLLWYHAAYPISGER